EGHGAGGRATGTAVAADIIEACKHAAKDEPKNRSLPYNQIRKIKSGDFFDLEMKSVMRVVTDNKAGVLAKLAQVLADKGVSLFGVSHKPNFEEIVAISLLLDRCPLKLVEEASKEISKLDFVKSEPLILPIDESEGFF
ncbi:MAG: hypothetical protein N4A36_00935, partial [Candidatus Gracilibacteria bacterium]|nr:hypothetical protein [Candidatus Gracilibacteria bacterium]